MLLPFSDGLTRVGKFDVESVFLADSHYSRQKVGSNQFMPPGKTIVLRDNDGTIVFGWLWQQKRDDGQTGYNCSIFHNESVRRASDVILEAEEFAQKEWGPNRMFTYVDPTKTKRSRTPGRCFLKAGWRYVRDEDGKRYRSSNGLLLLEKIGKTEAKHGRV